MTATLDIPERIGRFRIHSMLGRGAMGVVYKGHDENIDRLVAIKLIRTDLLDGEERENYFRRFRNEAKIAGRCVHANIVGLYDFSFHESNPYLVMEYVNGVGLQQALPRGTQWREEEVIPIGLQVLDALHYAHDRGIVHRDVKPPNILLTTESKLKITDFGISRLTSTEQTMTPLLIGTPSYMSPEQCMGSTLDGRSDLFSLGCVLYELLAGRRPFNGANYTDTILGIINRPHPPLQDFRDDLSPGLLAAIDRALAKNPDDRFADAGAFGRALEEVSEGVSSLFRTPAIPRNLSDIVATSRTRDARQQAETPPEALPPAALGDEADTVLTARPTEHTGQTPQAAPPEHTRTEHTQPEHTQTEHTPPEQASSEYPSPTAASEQPPTEPAQAQHTSPEHAGAEHLSSELPPTEQARPEHASPEHAAAEHGSSEHAATQHAPTEHTSPEHTAAHHTASEHAPLEHIPAHQPDTNHTDDTILQPLPEAATPLMAELPAETLPPAGPDAIAAPVASTAPGIATAESSSAPSPEAPHTAFHQDTELDTVQVPPPAAPLDAAPGNTAAHTEDDDATRIMPLPNDPAETTHIHHAPHEPTLPASASHAPSEAAPDTTAALPPEPASANIPHAASTLPIDAAQPDSTAHTTHDSTAAHPTPLPEPVLDAVTEPTPEPLHAQAEHAAATPEHKTSLPESVPFAEPPHAAAPEPHHAPAHPFTTDSDETIIAPLSEFEPHHAQATPQPAAEHADSTPDPVTSKVETSNFATDSLTLSEFAVADEQPAPEFIEAPPEENPEQDWENWQSWTAACLTRVIGPIAPIVVARFRDDADPARLVDDCADFIRDTAERADFMRFVNARPVPGTLSQAAMLIQGESR